MLSAALPNINGHFTIAHCQNNAASGCFKTSNGASNNVGDAVVAPNPYITFDASTSNSIYGRSDTVQPPTFALIAQIKY